MKRKNNGLIVGTVLILLVGALIFLQARNEEPSEDAAIPPVAATQPSAAPRSAPSVDKALDMNGPSRMPTPAPQ